MNRSELRAKLSALGVRDYYYDLDGGHHPECFTLRRENEGWSVYYSERGDETGIQHFVSEDEACERLFELIATHRHVPNRTRGQS